MKGKLKNEKDDEKDSDASDDGDGLWFTKCTIATWYNGDNLFLNDNYIS